MVRKCYVQVNGVLYDKEDLAMGLVPGRESNGGSTQGIKGAGGPTVLRDLPDFVSPIDGRLYSGRTGMRDHCARHDVVPTADLAGLPTRPPVVAPSKAEIREKIIETMHRKGCWDGHQYTLLDCCLSFWCSYSISCLVCLHLVWS